jgi:alpha-amylase
LAHGKREVREMSRAYLTWMRDSIGYDGFRFDFMKGIAGSTLFDYNRASAPYFCVAEVFDGNIDKQLGFLKDANYETYVFDFPGKFHYYNDAIGHTI